MPIIRLSPDGRELDALLNQRLGAPPRRGLLGLVGAPGVGKSTFSARIARLRPESVVVPMDGFHLADAELGRRGLRDRKGAPETFDSYGFAALLQRLRQRPDHVVMAPIFTRTIEEAVAGALPVPPDADFVIVEGNYLLLEADGWAQARGCLDEVWHLSVPSELRRARLLARHIEFGKTELEARAWVDRVDEPNAELIEASATNADLTIDLSRWQG